jgi:hypothetical protein
MTAVRAFTDKELLEKVEAIGGYIPNRGKYHIVGVQSQEDNFNMFDDKFYVYDGPTFIMWSTGTTNAGKTALLHFDDYNLRGAAVWKTNQFVKDCFKPGLHKQKMKALRANKPIYHYRDSNKNTKVEEVGKLYYANIWANMHGVDYDPFSEIIKQNINGWSFACQVWNRMSDYRALIGATWKRNKTVNYSLLKEW